MIIKAIWLHNIRSYKDEIVVFPEEGITVIYGDVGSGKTSILSAIGFAIFGNVPGSPTDPLSRFANPTARDLLRRGESRGFIKLWIRSEGRDIIVHREIAESGKTVSDKGGWVLVVEKGGSTKFRRLTASEMRSYILELLGIPEEKTRARSKVFASAIYVPQFGIHSILNVSEEERSEIVNRVLNLVKYSYAKERIDYVKALARRKLRKELEKRESELREKIVDETIVKERLRGAKEKLEKLEKEAKKLKEAEEKLKEKLRELEEKEKKLREKAGKAEVLRGELEELENEKKTKMQDLGDKSIGELENELSVLENEIRKIEDKLRKISSGREAVSKSKKELENILESKTSESKALHSKVAEIDGKIGELKRRLEEIRNLEGKGICPLCLQPVPHAHAKDLKERISKDIDKLLAEKEEVLKKLATVETNIEKMKRERSILEKEFNDLSAEERKTNEKLKNLLERKAKLRSLLEVAKDVAKIESRISKLKSELKKITKVTKELEKVNEEISVAKRDLENILKEKERINEEKGRLQGEIGSYEEKLREISRVKEELKKIREEINKNRFYLEFLDKNVLAIIREVERYVKSKAYIAFKEEFLRIFKTLMMGYENIDVEVSPDFKLEFKAKVDGSLVTIDTPSGGQLTSISLAYRLALNRVARSMIPQLREGLLILDEPTYGFSPERVELLRRVLFSPGGPKQVIIVTHDRSFYDVSGEEKLSIIRLELDSEATRTRVYYENIDLNYVGKVMSAFRNISRSIYKMSIEASTRHVKEQFKPEVKMLVSDKRSNKKTTSLLDFLSQTEKEKE